MIIFTLHSFGWPPLLGVCARSQNVWPLIWIDFEEKASNTPQVQNTNYLVVREGYSLKWSKMSLAFRHFSLWQNSRILGSRGNYCKCCYCHLPAITRYITHSVDTCNSNFLEAISKHWDMMGKNNIFQEFCRSYTCFWFNPINIYEKLC